MNTHQIDITLFSSESCPPCQALKHRLSLWHQDHKDLMIRTIPIDEKKDVAAKYGVLSAPTIIVFIDGQETIRAAGYFSLDELLQKVERYESLF